MEVCELHSGMETEIKNLKESDKQQWQAIQELQNRLPVWATVVISTLTFFCGAAMTYAALVVKISQVRT